MAFISVSKTYQLKQRVHPSIPRISNPLHFFCTTQDPTKESEEQNNAAPQPQQKDAPPQPQQEEEAANVVKQRTPHRGKARNPEKIEDTICRMMESRAWTTRLQNSIRNLVPEFDHSLVYNVLHRSRNSEHALQFFRWVERSGLIRHDREAHMKIIEILGGASKLNHARCILLDMPSKGVQWDEDMFVVMIESYGKAGIVQESVKMFQKMKELGVERTVKSYDALFKVILRRGRYMMAKRFYEDMKTREIEPDVVTYNTMINGYTRFKKMDEAEKLLVEMKGKNLAPTVISYTTMIKGYVAAEQVDDGLRLFEEMKSSGIKPNATTYSTLLPGLCDAGKTTEAKDILKEMVNRYIAPKDNSIFIKLLISQCKSGDLSAAHDVLRGMMRLSIPTEAGHYGVLIENFCKANEFDQAIKLLDKLVEKEIVLRPQSSVDIEASAYNPIIEYLCHYGQTGKAEVFFRQLMKKGVLDPIAFNNLIRGHAKEGNPALAFEILQIMDRRGLPKDADAYKLLIESYLRKGEPADAKTALDGMIEDGHLPESGIFKSVMESLFEDGRVQTASRVMKSMVEKGVKEHMDLVAKILETLLMRGHVEEAIGRIELLMQNGCAPNLDSLLSVLSEKGKTIAALKLLDFGLERDCSLDFSSYEKVLDALLAAGKTLNAYSILCKIMAKGGITDTNWSSLEDLINILNQEGNTMQADILSRMIRGEAASGSKKGKKHATVSS
ncbi:hypothetical protein COLO4_05681 [Corchorus olitorius]|uniref:Pentatricopeptide repeat-containing protein-mitochondrial domain-containing protein n=1 Tax=Corchorus olitorius TaxID=93759 RepID=A0A1R3KQ54_9ROSI|nr:hypothetical protein COLO4_05681 [Corchorus olitorius]